MALIIETGSGLRVAESYVSIAFILAYLTERGRETENLWSTASDAQQEAAARAATEYIDNRWGDRIKGNRRTYFAGDFAQAIVAFTGVPLADETITLGAQTYIWKASLAILGNDEIIIGADAAECATNLLNAITVQSEAVGVTSSERLPPNDAADALLEEGSTTELRLTARLFGSSGNDIPLSETSTNFDITTAFTNGLDRAPQQREFPRDRIFDNNGFRVTGIPIKLKEATAEYAVRARAAQLFIDPTVDDTGNIVIEKFEKVGPIEERTKYNEGGALSQVLRPYPAADKLLAEYILPAGRAFR